MNSEDYEWLKENINLLGNIKSSRESLIQLYAIYNRITGEQLKPSSCGRCQYNVKKRILAEYEKISNL